MDVARDNAAAAAAAVQTAAMKPNLSVSGGAGYETAAESPFLIAFDFSLPIETAGKRGYRIAEATHFSDLSRIKIAETAWAVRSQVRAALVNLVFANGTLRCCTARKQRRAILSISFKAAFAPAKFRSPEATTARIDLANVRQAVRTAEGQVESARAVLAAAIGISLSGLAGETHAWPGLDTPPEPTALPAQGMRAATVANRLDVQRALADYEAAQSHLQLEIARQYPDINLSPGYAFEEGAHLVSLELGVILPLRNRNQGPTRRSRSPAQDRRRGVARYAKQRELSVDLRNCG